MRTATGDTVFYCSPFLIVIPGCDQQEGHGVRRAVVFFEYSKSVLERLSATRVNVAIQTPGCTGVIESRPYRADCDLVGMFRLHPLVEGFKVALAPLLSVARPTFGSGVNPGILAVKCIRVLRRRFIFIYEEWRRFPAAYHLAYLVPVRVGSLRKNENHGLALIEEVGVPSSSLGADVAFVRHVECVKR